jgi:tRNA threonylcarbamoyladenosine modification (KEOPS) complex Cgi121 subunit
MVLTVIIEKLTTKDGELCIGICENQNLNNLDTDNLLKLASSLSESVLAFQLFNSLMIADSIHLLSGAQNALNAMNGKYMISRSLDVELAVYVSAQRQIGLALDIVGVKDQLTSIAAVCIDEDEEKVWQCLTDVAKRVGEEVTPMFNPNSEKISSLMETFGITDLEIQQFTKESDLVSRTKALSKCIVSKVSQVALGS